MIVGILDTGIDIDQSELIPNIHPGSKDIYDGSVNLMGHLTPQPDTPFSINRSPGGGSLDDIDGHGTFVAGLIAAIKNDNLSHGLAFDAQLLAVRIDNVGSCPNDCAFQNDAIAAGLNYAVSKGANVVNISLGGSGPNDHLAAALRDAVSAGVVVVISAGNASKNSPPDANPDPLSLAALANYANGQIIIAGSSNQLGTISGFSSRAGVGAAFYLLAPGENVSSTTVNSSTGASVFGTGSGTSFAAPHISAAVALLMEKFPALSAADIVDILLTTATDLGVPGIDTIYGHGLLNLEKAIAPIGTTALHIITENGVITVDTGPESLVVGDLFGDGFGNGFSSNGGAIFTDSYDRAYVTDFGDRIVLANPSANFSARFEAAVRYKQAAVAVGTQSTLFVGTGYDVQPTPYERDHLGLTSRHSDEMDGASLRLETWLDARRSVTLGFGGSLREFLDDTGVNKFGGAGLAKGIRLPWLSDRAAGVGHGGWQSGLMDGGQRFGASHVFDNGLVLSGAVARDAIAYPQSLLFDERTGRLGHRTMSVVRLGKDSQAGMAWAASFGQVDETGTVLGSYSTGALELGNGATTRFASFGGTLRLGSFGERNAGAPTISLFGHVVGALTDIDEAPGSSFSGFTGLAATQGAAGIAVDSALVLGDRLTLTVSQPLRLERGKVVYGFATGFDYDTGTAIFDDTRRKIVPSGRELEVELGWHVPVGPGAQVSANLLYQHEPGHISGRDDALGIVISGRRSF